MDWAQPWTFLNDLHTWIEIWHEKLGKVLSSLPLDDQDQMVHNIERYLRRYKDPTEENKEKVIDETMSEIPLPEGVLQVNLGVPVIIICCKSDLIWSVDKNRDQCERILDFTLKTLREFAVTYGASIIYTSSKTGTNVNALYQYVVHRLYGFKFNHRAQIIDRENIFVPAGWDSPNLIREMDYLGMSEKQFNDLLPKPKHRSAAKEEIAIVSDQDFLLQARERLANSNYKRSTDVSNMIKRPDPVRPGGEIVVTSEVSGESAQQGAKKNLHEFYKMLLEKGNKEASDS